MDLLSVSLPSSFLKLSVCVALLSISPDPPISVFFPAGFFQALSSLRHSDGEGSAEATGCFGGLAGPASPSACVCCACVSPLLPCNEAPGRPAVSAGEGSGAHASGAKTMWCHQRRALWTAAEHSTMSPSAPRWEGVTGPAFRS